VRDTRGVALAVILLVGAAACAWLTGGRWSALAALPIRGVRLVVIAVVAQVAGSSVARLTGWPAVYPIGLALSAIAALAFCIRNLRLAGIPLITLGLVSNALVVTLNGAMPVSRDAAARARVSVMSIAAGDDSRHEVAGSSTALRPLGDVIPLPLPWQPEVVSPGDALIAAGIGELVLLGMRPRRRRALASTVSRTQPPAAVALSRPTGAR
jgi:hypothetical protein